MKNFKGTQGQWRIWKNDNGIQIHSDEILIADVIKHGNKAIHNASLICDAPKMLELLEQIVSEFSAYKNAHGTNKCDLILKAEDIVDNINSSK